MRSPWKLVTVDIDGTLTLGHGWQHIAEGFGRRAEYDVIMAEFHQGGVSEDRHLERLLGLARGRRVEEVERLLETTPRISGISEGNEQLHALGLRVCLLSHNPPLIGRWYARRFGFDDFAPMPGNFPDFGEIPLPQGVRADKLGGLTYLRERFGTPLVHVLHVGDGAADAMLFPRVGGGVAFNSRLASVQEAADAVIDADDWRALLPLVGRLRPRPER